MYSPTRSKHTYKEDTSQINTNYKSSFLNNSTQINTSRYGQSLAVSKLQYACKTIDEVIVDLSAKKDMNDDAINQVRSANSQMMGEFRTHYLHESKINKQIVSSTFAPDYSSQYGINYDWSIESEDFALRERLNQELRKNNQLLIRLSALQQQNKQIKRNGQWNFSHSPQSKQLYEQNQLLRHKIQAINIIPQEVINEIEQLRKENQALRRNTKRLIEKSERV